MSLKRHINYVWILVLLVLALGGAFYSMISDAQESGYEDVINNNTMISLEIQTKIENLIANNYDVLDLLATYPEVHTYDGEILDPILDQAVSVYTNLYPIGIADHTGMQVAKSNKAKKVNISDRAHFMGPMKGESYYISNILTSKADGSYICIMAVPIRDVKTKQPSGVIVGMLNLHVLNDYINSVEVNISEKILSNTTSYIVDKEGYLLAHPDYEFEVGQDRPDYSKYKFVQDGLKGDCNTTTYIDDSGNEMLVSYVVDKTTGWIICSEISMAVAQSDLIKKVMRLSLVYLAVIIILILIIVMLFLNIKKRQVAEQSLAKLNESLEEEVEVRSKELERTIKELTDKERMASLGSLVAGVAHEINTPIGVAITASTYIEKSNADAYEMLKEGQFGKNSLINYMEKMDESTGIISSNLQRAAELVRNFKNLAVNQSVHEVITFNLKSYIDSVVLALKHEYKNRPITIDVDIDETLDITSYSGDYSQIITNLLMNSLKHGFKAEDIGHIHICGKEEDDVLILVYEDDGAGIDDFIINKIYDPFFTSNRNSENSGLGMNIVYNIVNDRLKGRIKCESSVGQGVRFTIRVPLEV